MAIIASTQVLYDGTVNASIKAIGISDGNIEGGPNETTVTKVSVKDLIPVGGKIKILSIEYDVSYGVVTLSWDAPNIPVDFIHLDGFGKFTFPNGGLVNAADGASGDILLTTRGFELNSTYSITLRMRKKSGHGPWG